MLVLELVDTLRNGSERYNLQGRKSPPVQMEYADSDGDDPRTIFFATIPFEYLADTAPYWAEKGVSGFMLAKIMRNWDSDIWKVGEDRIVGADNPLFGRLKRMNEACRSSGVDRNFIKIAFYSHLPDWFDDEGWGGLVENFRQASIFARDAGFRGIAIDIEYISEIYDLSWPAYHEPGYRFSDLRGTVESRGAQIVEAMLGEFPSMELLHLPQSPECYGRLASDIFAGMCMGMSRNGAPGGLHILTEGTYQNTNVEWLVRYRQDLDRLVEDVIPEECIPYWRSRCSVSFGLWPLGYYRDIYGDEGKFLGYGGKREKFGDEVVGSRADKSENYGVEEFRRQFAVSRMACDRYIWIYCHGSVFWELDEDEVDRYGGSESDALPVVDNLNDYIQVLERGQVLDDEEIRHQTSRIGEKDWVDFIGGIGSPLEWNLVGPFPNENGEGFGSTYPPEEHVDLEDTYQGDGGEASWQVAKVLSTGHVDLHHIYRPPNYRLAYAYCYVDAEEARNGKILFGSDDGAKIWLGDELVFELDVVRGAEPDDDSIPISLSKGRTPILLKVCNYKGTWGFYFRIVGQDGRAIPGVTFSVV